jgi:copper chaperone
MPFAIELSSPFDLAAVPSLDSPHESPRYRYHQMEMPERKGPELTVKIDGMHCGACVRRVSQALGSVPGVQVNEVRIGAARFTALHDPPPVAQAIDAIARSGYAAHLES